MPAPLRLFAAVLLVASVAAHAQEAEIRKNLAERLPGFPKIDEVSKSSVPGLYEIRIGNEIVYSDERGDHLIQGDITDTKSRVNLTQERTEKLSAVDFKALPLKDAIVYRQGTGARKIAVFADPNCGYCKKFERDLQQIKDVTVYTFLYPILGGDSPEKAKNIWCAKDNTSVWRAWMVNGSVPARQMAACDASAIDRNTAMGRKFRVTGTPSLVFEDGKRVPGALPPDEVEKHFALSRAKS